MRDDNSPQEVVTVCGNGCRTAILETFIASVYFALLTSIASCYHGSKHTDRVVLEYSYSMMAYQWHIVSCNNIEGCHLR